MNLRTKYISGPAIYCVLLSILLALFFELWRLILLVLVDDWASEIPTGVVMQSFVVGWRFDFAIASFILMPLAVLGLLPFIDIARNRLVRKIHTWLAAVMAAAVFFLHLADIEFFDFFNVRLNGMALQWEDTPGMMLSMIWETYPVIRYLVLYAVVLAAFVLAMRRLQRKVLDSREISPFWVNLFFLPVILLVFFVGARGRIEEKTPLRWGIAYFSEYDFANQLALNPTYTFLHDAVYESDKKEDLRTFVEEFARPDADRVVRDLLAIPVSDSGESDKVYRRVTFDPPPEDPPNVILIVMESFGATKVDVLNNIHGVELSPHFDSLAGEGILFSRMYSEGMHTYSGVFSTLFGYPHLLGKLLMKQVRGEFHLWGLPAIFREHDYQTMFFLTHDPHFDNTQGFMMSNGFKRVISSLDYDAEQRLSTWGVPDHVMFDRVLEETHRLQGGRFFMTLLTASNHGPWIVPEVPFGRVPPGTKDEVILNAFKYSDWALGRFVRQVQADPAFDNTLIFITSDNGAGGSHRIDMDLSYFHMPLLILDTRDRLPRGEIIAERASQMDILPTVLGLVRLDYDDYSFGRDLLDTSSRVTPFVYLSEWYRIGYIENDYYFVARMRGRGPKSLYHLPDIAVDLADSLPELLSDYEAKALAIFQVGYYDLFKPLVGRDSSHFTSAARQ
ncbi:MAG: sulfatase-like hydrolase/transferase [candidate division Zixibacteria bacterium]|nr:sulfatase-like hydrolase/transferase [candidate division Zixibacteria bacterium]